jgi:cyanate permease
MARDLHAPLSSVFGLLPPLPTACFGCFCLFVFVLFSYFSGHTLLMFGSNFMRIFVGY